MNEYESRVLQVLIACASVVAITYCIAIYSNDYNRAALKTQEICIQHSGTWTNSDRCDMQKAKIEQ